MFSRGPRRPDDRPPASPAPAGYEKVKAAAAARAARISAAGRDIAAGFPEPENPRRRKRYAANFAGFCRHYFPATFSLPWSADHLRITAKIEQATLEGGLFALAMPRGSGKTSLVEAAAIWAVVYAHRRFVVVIGASEEAAGELLKSAKIELETNDRLLADFPEICYPIRQLDGIVNRAAGQTYQGHRTKIQWTAHSISLPSIPGSAAAGATIKTAGITGRIRGLKHKLDTGETIRPDLVIIDDPQTDDSARSPSQVAYREGILAGAILGLAGPGKQIAGIMPCTVIRPGDMADRILDRTKHPEWSGERTKLIYRWPDRADLWEEYLARRRADLADGGDTATTYYRANRAEMDAGAEVAWAARKRPGELSALQHAYNLLGFDQDSRDAFAAEYQNEPVTAAEQGPELSAEYLATKVNGYGPRTVPIDCHWLTSFIDVQQSSLWWVVAGWTTQFTGYVLDYGVFPDPGPGYYTLASLKNTLSRRFPGAGVESQIFQGLGQLVNSLLRGPWQRDDGASMNLDRILIDANWGATTDVIYQFARQSGHARILPSHGRYIGAASKPLSEYQRRPGDLTGLNWRIPAATASRAARHVIFDANYWKTFVFNRLGTQFGDPGNITFYKPATLAGHRILADHLTSEYRTTTFGRGRTVDEYKLRPDATDNHFLDALVGAAVAASIEGASLDGMPGPRRGPRRRRHVDTL